MWKLRLWRTNRVSGPPRPALLLIAGLATLFLVDRGDDQHLQASAGEGLAERALRLAKTFTIVDTHIDLPYRLQVKWDDVSVRAGDGDFDYPRARQGGLDVAFMSIYVPARLEGSSRAKLSADVLIDSVEKMVARSPGKFAIVSSPGEIREAVGKQRVLLAMGIENGSALEGNLAYLRHFHRRGVRYITLAHSRSNHLADASYDSIRRWNGLSPFGRSVVREMNRLGMMVDVSHLSDSAFYDVLRVSVAPVIASHSACRFFTPGLERNMSDEMIRALANQGGVIQINFGSMFISNTARLYSDVKRRDIEEHLRLRQLKPGGREARAFTKRYDIEHPFPYATVADVANHIDHVVGLVGVDHVGFGSDFDGVGNTLPVGLKDVSAYPNLILELLSRGYSEADIRQICGGNLLRVWEQVEAYSEQTGNQ